MNILYFIPLEYYCFAHVGVANKLYEVQISGLWVLGTVNNTTQILLLHYHSLLVTRLLHATRGDAGLTAHRRIFVPTHIAGAITLRAKQMTAKRKRRKYLLCTVCSYNKWKLKQHIWKNQSPIYNLQCHISSVYWKQQGSSLHLYLIH